MQNINLTELADELGLSRQRVHTLIKEAKIPAGEPLEGGSRKLWSPDAVVDAKRLVFSKRLCSILESDKDPAFLLSSKNWPSKLLQALRFFAPEILFTIANTDVQVEGERAESETQETKCRELTPDAIDTSLHAAPTEETKQAGESALDLSPSRDEEEEAEASGGSHLFSEELLNARGDAWIDQFGYLTEPSEEAQSTFLAFANAVGTVRGVEHEEAIANAYQLLLERMNGGKRNEP